MVSVIVPVYNAEKTLARCVDSVVRQSYEKWELLLVDDGSSDSSLDICRRFSSNDKRIQVIAKENGGVSSARNRGLQEAEGEYVVFLDSDDRLIENALSVLVGIAETYRADCVVCGIKQDSGKLWAPERYQHYVSIVDFKRDFINHLTSELFSVCFNKLYRRQLITKQFMNGCSFGEDLIFVLDYLDNCNSIEIIPDALYRHNNLNECSISHNINHTRLIDIETYQRRVLTFYGQIEPPVFNKYLQDITVWLYKLYSARNNIKEKKAILENWRKVSMLRDGNVRKLVKGVRKKMIVFNALYVPVRMSCGLLNIGRVLKYI